MGGPIGRPGSRNKLFFFYSQEFSPRTKGNDVVRYRMPTALERAGDFSQTAQTSGPVQLFDPSTHQPLPGNVIPVSRINPIAAGLLSYIPLPNNSQVYLKS